MRSLHVYHKTYNTFVCSDMSKKNEFNFFQHKSYDNSGSHSIIQYCEHALTKQKEIFLDLQSWACHKQYDCRRTSHAYNLDDLSQNFSSTRPMSLIHPKLVAVMKQSHIFIWILFLIGQHTLQANKYRVFTCAKKRVCTFSKQSMWGFSYHQNSWQKK